MTNGSLVAPLVKTMLGLGKYLRIDYRYLITFHPHLGLHARAAVSESPLGEYISISITPGVMNSIRARLPNRLVKRFWWGN